MEKIKYILIALAFIGCVEETQYSISPDLKPYYDSFMKEAKARSAKIDGYSNLVMFVRKNTLKDYGGWGITRKVPGGQHYIYVDMDFANQYPERVEATVWHELGHCYLDRGHNEIQSLMNPQVSGFGWPKRQIDKDWLITEMFYNR